MHQVALSMDKLFLYVDAAELMRYIFHLALIFADDGLKALHQLLPILLQRIFFALTVRIVLGSYLLYLVGEQADFTGLNLSRRVRCSLPIPSLLLRIHTLHCIFCQIDGSTFRNRNVSQVVICVEPASLDERFGRRLP